MSESSTTPIVSDDGDFLSLATLRRRFEECVNCKHEEMRESRTSEEYYHHVQWTADQVEAFKARKQPIVTFPRVGRKIDGVVGLSEQQRQDPKAYPRNPEGAEGADVATAVIRYVAERNEWATKKPQGFRDAVIKGIAGVEFRLVSGDKGDLDIEIEPVDRRSFFYDARSMRPNFTDAREMGVAKLLDLDEAIELFPDQEDALTSANGVLADVQVEPWLLRPMWQMTTRKQVFVVEHWYKWKREWRWCFYVGWHVLAQGVSPFFDERGKTVCRFQMFSAYIDHDGDRYGLNRALKGMQDEINHRRSSALFRSNARRIIADKGAVDDITQARREWARPDGWIEKNPGADLTPDNTTQDVAAQFQFLQDAKDEMEAYANINPAALSGGNVNLSGRAVNMLQKPGIAELGPLLIGYRNWVIRVYRMMWNTAQRHWNSERWIRVTDNQKVAQFIQLNGMKLDEWGRPVLVNALGALDVDIVIDEGPDVQNMMQDAWDVLSQLPPGTVPMDVLVAIMPIPEDVRQQWTAKLSQPDPMGEMAKQIALKQASGKVDETTAATALKHAQALNQLAGAAHKGSLAHIDAARIFDGGLSDVGSVEQAGKQSAPQPQQGPQAAPPMAPPQPAQQPAPFQSSPW